MNPYAEARGRDSGRPPAGVAARDSLDGQKSSVTETVVR
jgi:hypothetical protein